MRVVIALGGNALSTAAADGEVARRLHLSFTAFFQRVNDVETTVASLTQ